jgi:hypothetical protein
MTSRLPRTSSALRRLLGGPGNAWTRHAVRSTAERYAARPGATADQVLAAIRNQHGKRMADAEYDQLRLALEIDLPAAPAGGAA